MKNFWLVAFLFGALFISSCGNSDTAEPSVINQQNDNKSAEPKSIETPPERHVKVKSERGFDETYDALKKAIESKEPLAIVAELDHSANAKKAGIELRPTKVIMFGNPALGTPLMKANQEIGVDLPQKMLVYEDEKGNVYVLYNDPNVLAENHNISGQDEVLTKISGALKGLAEAAAKKEGK